MPRKMKVTRSPDNKAYQNRRTEMVEKATEDLQPLQMSPPNYMKGTIAGRAWQRITPILRQSTIIKNADRSTVEALCSAIALYRIGFDDVQENGIQTPIYKSVQNNRGEIIDRDFIGFKKNPAVSTMDAAIRQIRSLSSELGLTPTSRAALLLSLLTATMMTSQAWRTFCRVVMAGDAQVGFNQKRPDGRKSL